jgi:F420-non-reducing hydrogenase large subunit
VKTITIQPVSRIEGHAKVTIQLDEAGNVADTHVNVIELRGFERFAIGRPVEELTRIMTRICGVCPWSHHLASSKACDAVFGVTPPPAGVKLRKLCNSTAYCEEHILHFYFLGGPDFVMGPDADPAVRNVMGIAQKHPDLGRQVVRARQTGAHMLEIIAGKSIHPDVSVPGGFQKPLTETERDELKPMAKSLLAFAVFSMKFAKESIFPQYLDTVKNFANLATGFLGTVTSDGAFDVYGETLRLMQSDGTHIDFPVENYTDYISEHVEPWSYLKFPYMKARPFSMDLDKPSGIYRTNTLARINVCDRMPTPLAQAELEEFRKNFGRPAQFTLLYHWARLIELLYNAEHVNQLLDDPQICDGTTRAACTPRAARGVGSVEAPRGTLIHDYTTDSDGIVTDCNLIVGTTHNNAAINMSVKRAATDLIKRGKYDQGTLNRVEMAIRAYDPCISCATHEMDGRIPVKVTILDADGQIRDVLSNT